MWVPPHRVYAAPDLPPNPAAGSPVAPSQPRNLSATSPRMLRLPSLQTEDKAATA
jgi:hypothetical protein